MAPWSGWPRGLGIRRRPGVAGMAVVAAGGRAASGRSAAVRPARADEVTQWRRSPPSCPSKRPSRRRRALAGRGTRPAVAATLIATLKAPTTYSAALAARRSERSRRCIRSAPPRCWPSSARRPGRLGPGRAADPAERQHGVDPYRRRRLFRDVLSGRRQRRGRRRSRHQRRSGGADHSGRGRRPSTPDAQGHTYLWELIRPGYPRCVRALIFGLAMFSDVVRGLQRRRRADRDPRPGRTVVGGPSGVPRLRPAGQPVISQLAACCRWAHRSPSSTSLAGLLHELGRVPSTLVTRPAATSPQASETLALKISRRPSQRSRRAAPPPWTRRRSGPHG